MYAANIIGMINFTGNKSINMTTTAIGFLSTPLVSEVVTIAMDVTGSMGNINAMAYPMLTPAKMTGNMCPPRQPDDKQNSVKNSFIIPTANSSQIDMLLHPSAKSVSWCSPENITIGRAVPINPSTNPPTTALIIL